LHESDNSDEIVVRRQKNIALVKTGRMVLYTITN